MVLDKRIHIHSVTVAVMPLFPTKWTHKLELDSVDDRSCAEDERGEAGQDDHRVKRQEEVIVLISWTPEPQIAG